MTKGHRVSGITGYHPGATTPEWVRDWMYRRNTRCMEKSYMWVRGL